MSLYKDLVKKVSISPEKKVKQKEYIPQGCLPIVDQGKSLVGGYSNDTSKELSCKLPVIVFGDHTRAVKFIDFPFGPGADGIKVLEPKQGILPKYLYYATQYLVLCLEDKGYARHYQHIEKKEIEIPEIDEQKRIVSKTEELLSQLDDGVETLNKIKMQLKVYRQAVLTKAYPENDENNKRYLKEIAEISSGITKGRKLEEYGTVKLPYLRVANVQNGFLDLSEVKEIELKKTEMERFLLRYDDVLYTEGGDRDKLGRGTVWKNEIPNCVHQNHVFKARVNKEIANPEYVALWSMSTPARNYFYEKGKQSVNLASINKTVLSNLEIPILSLNEQVKVVEEINARLSVCDYIEQTVDKTLQQAEALRQSILKRAFGGEV